MKFIKKSPPLAVCAISALLSFAAQAVAVSDMAGLATAISGNEDITLTKDIDCTGWTTAESFTGKLNGGGNTLSGLTAPLFDVLGDGAVVQNLVIDGASVEAKSGAPAYVGILANRVETSDAGATLSNIRFINSTLSVVGGKNDSISTFGFLAGYFGQVGTVEGCVTEGSCAIAQGATRKLNMGSLLGEVRAVTPGKSVVISGCCSATAYTFTSDLYEIGGIASSASVGGAKDAAADDQMGQIWFVDCTNLTSFSGYTSSKVGGIVARAQSVGTSSIGKINFVRCLNYGDIVTTKSPNVSGYSRQGGLVALASYLYATFTDCVNFGDVKSTNAGDAFLHIAGFVGYMTAPFRKPISFIGCANVGTISGYITSGFIGGCEYNANYKGTFLFESCLQRGQLASTKSGYQTGEFFGEAKSTCEYQSIEFYGCLSVTSALYGTPVAGADITKNMKAGDNLVISGSEILVDSSPSGALALLNGYKDCQRWKQGHDYPILKILPDEESPDTVVVTFKDAEEFESEVYKRSVISRGGTVSAPAERPEHEGYTFLGWTMDGETTAETFENLMDDADIVALYQDGVLEYEVEFLDWDDSVLTNEVVRHGEAAVPPPDPVREGCIFTGWDKDFSVVVGPMTIRAQYVMRDQDIATAEDFARVLSAADIPEVTYHLVADLVLPGDWTPIPEFIATLDGAGHVIRQTAAVPIFGKVRGCVRDLVLDGEVEGEATQIDARSDFGFLAERVDGGVVEGIVVRNYRLSHEKQNGYAGFIAATVRNGGGIRNCRVEGSCDFEVRYQPAGCGGIAGGFVVDEGYVPVDDQGEPLIGVEVARVESCTNDAPVLKAKSDGATAAVGGIVGSANIYNSALKFAMTITNCANTAGISGAEGLANPVYAGGILGIRNPGSGNAPGGTLVIVDCVNEGPVAACSAKGGFGGIVGAFDMAAATEIRRCVNRGAVGTEGCSGSYACGGIFGRSGAVNANPIEVYDSANYGDVIGNACAGGIGGQVSQNDGHTTRVDILNCANYGEVSALTNGQALACFVTVMKVGYATHTVSNCFFMTDVVCGYLVPQTSPDHMRQWFGANYSPLTEGYALKSAVRQLNEYAAANGYEPWVKGKVGKEIYPELGIFNEKPGISGLLMIIR